MTRFSVAAIFLAGFFTLDNQLIAQDFRVQIAAYGERMKPSFFEERGIENYVETTDQLGLYRYFAGAYKTRDEAEVVRKEVAAKGFPYALIIDLEEQRVLCGGGCPYFRNGTVYVKDIQRQETTNTIYFEFGRYSLTPDSKAVLNRFYDQLRDNPKLKLKIHGFTDGIGSREANLRLSANRARSARNYLTYKGIRVDRMLMEVFGEGNPILANKDEGDDRTDSPENRKWNRRVVLLLVNDFGEAATDDSVIRN
ncbi:MAG: OmpA family protein [Saprospiraceae bacterium]|nr:OmpA family protein [Saprospiraceae bacterium]